ncbi:hypothetical protein SKAU_G00292970 [Synaphobranchus kaupii]|uniref:Uncharacterized protein n=1 Tax=Synaphobranchus kaupii TaxID=118154 RepID=A0A9Q1IMA0_SYNKA|nr:hypothetical protein SKAU_G00292970 [Synaphobranchus kaupii]
MPRRDMHGMAQHHRTRQEHFGGPAAKLSSDGAELEINHLRDCNMREGVCGSSRLEDSDMQSPEQPQSAWAAIRAQSTAERDEEAGCRGSPLGEGEGGESRLKRWG